MFSRSPFSRAPFSRSISGGDAKITSDYFHLILHENAAIDKSLIAEDSINITIVPITKILLPVSDSLDISVLTNTLLNTQIQPYDTLQLKLITSYLKDLNLFDNLLVTITETPIHTASDILTDILKIVIDEQVTYLFTELDVIRVINTKVDNTFIISSSIDNIKELRGDYTLPQIGQNLEMWAGEAINIHIQGVLPEDFDDLKWRVLETPDSTDAVIEKSLTGTGLEIIEGNIIIDLNFEDTKDLGGNRYFHETRIWNGPDPNTVATGKLKIKPSSYVIGESGKNGG